MFGSRRSRIWALPGYWGSRIAALVSHGRSGLRGCLGGRSPQGLSKNRRIQVLHDDDISVSNISLYLLQVLLIVGVVSRFPALPLLLNFSIEQILK